MQELCKYTPPVPKHSIGGWVGVMVNRYRELLQWGWGADYTHHLKSNRLKCNGDLLVISGKSL